MSCVLRLRPDVSPTNVRDAIRVPDDEFLHALVDVLTPTRLREAGGAHQPERVRMAEGIGRLWMHSRALAEALEHKHPSTRRAGQVLALATPNGPRFFQVMVDHPLQSTIGHVVRALVASGDVHDAHAAALESAPGGDLLLVDASLFERRDVTVLGTEAVASTSVAFRYPMGEDAAGVRWWGVWRGGTTTSDRWPDPLSPEQAAVPRMDTLTAEQLSESA